jgi:hypothetical protein
MIFMYYKIFVKMSINIDNIGLSMQDLHTYLIHTCEIIPYPWQNILIIVWCYIFNILNENAQYYDVYLDNNACKKL